MNIIKKYLFIVLFVGVCHSKDATTEIEKNIIDNIKISSSIYDYKKKVTKSILYSSLVITPISGNLVSEETKPEVVIFPVFTAFTLFYLKSFLDLKNFTWIDYNKFKKDEFLSNNIDSVSYFNLYVDKLASFAATTAIEQYKSKNNLYCFNILPKYIVSGFILTQFPLELGFIVFCYGGYSFIKSLLSWNYFKSYQRNINFTKNLEEDYKKRFLLVYDNEVKKMVKENNLNINRDKLTKTITNIGLMGCVYLSIIVQLALDSLVWG